MKKLLFAFIVLLFRLCFFENAFAQTLEVKTLLYEEVEETSGLAWINNTIVTHNDSGHDPVLYEISGTTGAVLRSVTINNATNEDWEDLCSDDTYIYIGDFGNNKGTRKDLKIYRIRKDDYIETDNDEVEADTISFNYADQTDFSDQEYSTNYDAEAIVACDDQLYIFTKNWGDFKSNIYAVPKIPGTHSLEKITDIDTQGVVTGAACNQEGDEVTLIGYTQEGTDFIMKLTDFQSSGFSELNSNRYDLTMPDSSSILIEGITYVSNDEILISAEAFQNADPVLYTLSVSVSSCENLIDDCRIYPNPVQSDVHIVYDGFAGVEVYDVKGELQLYSSESDVCLDNLNKGVYVLKILNESTSSVLSYKLFKY